MVMNEKHKNMDNEKLFTLDERITYQIQIAGQLSETWSDWIDNMDCQLITYPSGLITTNLTGSFDQAALIGLLRRLYSLGYPLISVNYLQKK